MFLQDAFKLPLLDMVVKALGGFVYLSLLSNVSRKSVLMQMLNW